MSNPVSVEVTIVSILSEVLEQPEEDLREYPILAAYHWDSLRLLEALAHMESQLGITLDLRSYQAARTVDDLVELVQDAAAKTPTGQR
jgi:acyl carrier protein